MPDTQPTLPTDRAHDLPPRWDGHVVVWDGWEAGALSDVRLCPPLPRECCPACGSLAEPTTNRGRVARSGITTRQQIAARDASRRQLGWASHNLRTLAVYRLTAFRCPDCRHDRVLENLTTWWDLDESDYTDDGSFDA